VAAVEALETVVVDGRAAAVGPATRCSDGSENGEADDADADGTGDDRQHR
jgi:hypothetical protein